MSSTRRSKRARAMAKRKAVKKAKKRNGVRVGSIAVLSRLPGLEGAQLGEMEVVVDKRRKKTIRH